MQSGGIGIGLEFFDPIFKPFPEVLACTFGILIVAFIFNMVRPQIVKAEVSMVFLLILRFR